jgi:hypothetical protein
MTQLDVRPADPSPDAPEDLIKEARRRQKRRIRVITVSVIVFASIVAATVVGFAGRGGGGSGNGHAQAPASPPNRNGAPIKHTTPIGAGDLPVCSNGSSPIPAGASGCELTGIQPNAQASQLFGWTFEVTNSYSAISHGQDITVYAGAVLAPDPTDQTAHGIPNGAGVRISVAGGTSTQQFLLPGTLGLLTIKSVSGSDVTLERQDGTTVSFNLASDTYA